MIYKRGCNKKGANGTCSKCGEDGACGVYWVKTVRMERPAHPQINEAGQR